MKRRGDTTRSSPGDGGVLRLASRGWAGRLRQRLEVVTLHRFVSSFSTDLAEKALAKFFQIVHLL
jgi:hypothetical protein